MHALIVANLAGFADFLISDMAILKEMGYDVTFAANGEKLPWDDVKEKLQDLQVPFIQIDFDSKNPLNANNIKAFTQLRKLLSEKHYDLVHCHTPIAGMVVRAACLPCRRKGTKVVYTTHGFTFTGNSSKKQWMLYYSIENVLSRFSDAMITINREDYKNAKTMHCKKVYYINGVGTNVAAYRDVELDRAAFRKSLGIAEDKIMILSVGELSERKNHQAVIRALALMEDKDRYCYAVCGNGINGGVGAELQKLAEEKQVDLRLLGFRMDIPEVLHCSDIGAIPSQREGLGMAGIQSLAAGVPLVGTDVQGIRDYIIDGKTGFLCGAWDYPGIADAIRRLSDENLRSAMRPECIRKAEEFDMSVSEKQRKKIFEELLQ